MCVILRHCNVFRKKRRKDQHNYYSVTPVPTSTAVSYSTNDGGYEEIKCKKILSYLLYSPIFLIVFI